MSALPIVVNPRRPGSTERVRLERRARRLAWGGNLWHVAEFAIALAAGISASSIALVGFGIDSLIEVLAGSVVGVALHRPPPGVGGRRAPRSAGDRALVLPAGGLRGGRVRTDARRLRPSRPELVGIGLAAVTAPTMPLLARAKRRVGHRLGSAATVAEGAQNLLCAYLSVALLAGLGANALLGWWWADPLAGLAIAAVAAREGLESWRGRACADAAASG